VSTPARRKLAVAAVPLYGDHMGTDTVGYGGARVRVTAQGVFVVNGSETVAAVADEGWNDVEHAFFSGGVLLDRNLALVAASPRRRWLREALWGAAFLGGLVALVWIGAR
jgi:hypothetical protein